MQVVLVGAKYLTKNSNHHSSTRKALLKALADAIMGPAAAGRRLQATSGSVDATTIGEWQAPPGPD